MQLPLDVWSVTHSIRTDTLALEALLRSEDETLSDGERTEQSLYILANILEAINDYEASRPTIVPAS